MSVDGDNVYNSDNEAESDLDDDKHNKLIENVLNISKKPKLKKPTRTEPTLQVSEFNLVKSSTGKQGNVKLRDLTKSLKKISKHINLGQQVEAVEKKSKTLSKPLEKPQAERIRRTIAYEETKKQLNRWDAVVTANRAASTLRFPLNDNELKVDFNAKPEDCFNWGKTELQIALEKVSTPKEVETIEINTDKDEFPLTMEEMMEKRKETAKLRAVQSYQEAKARRQNKIKSKKFHKIERKAKAKQQLKEFEDLQKINPEAALEKLEQLERASAQERASLRHKSTGQWAKNKQIRAKYDKESRQVLAEQLAISRDLTQKLKKTSESESEDDVQNEDTFPIEVDADNPWASNVNIKPTQEVTTFLSKIKTFSNNQNQLDKQNKEVPNSSKIELNDNKINTIPSNQKSLLQGITNKNETLKKLSSSKSKKEKSIELIENINSAKKVKKRKRKNSTDVVKLCELAEDKSDTVEKGHKKKDKRINTTVDFNCGDEEIEPSKCKRAKIIVPNAHLEDSCGSTWLVTSAMHGSTPSVGLLDLKAFDGEIKVLRKLSVQKRSKTKTVPKSQISQKINIEDIEVTTQNVDNIFAGLDKKLRGKVQEKMDTLRKNKDKPTQRNVAKNAKPKAKKNKSNFEMLELKKNRRQTRSNDGLIEGDDVENEQQLNDLNRLEDILEKAQSVKKREEIDPNKFLNMKPVKLNTELPDVLVNAGDDIDGSDEEDALRSNQRNVISEAFCDDDIVEDFHRDKQKEIDKNTPKDINLIMPGWGSWGGKHLKVPKRKRRRFILKAPKPEVRKDSNRGHLIINEEGNNAKLAKHLVSDVPFPYKDVKEYEISLKTPIDGTFIPQTAFRKFIEPPVITKIGTIIEPMTEDVLLKKKKTFK